MASKVNFKYVVKIYQWCNKWEMRINKEKSSDVHFRKHRRLRSNFVFRFEDNDLNIVIINI